MHGITVRNTFLEFEEHGQEEFLIDAGPKLTRQASEPAKTFNRQDTEGTCATTDSSGISLEDCAWRRSTTQDTFDNGSFGRVSTEDDISKLGQYMTAVSSMMPQLAAVPGLATQNMEVARAAAALAAQNMEVARATAALQAMIQAADLLAPGSGTVRPQAPLARPSGVRFCPSCGTAVEAQHRFCSQCRYPLSGLDAGVVAVQKPQGAKSWQSAGGGGNFLSGLRRFRFVEAHCQDIHMAEAALAQHASSQRCAGWRNERQQR